MRIFMEKQYVIPIFVPHLGCPNDCIFCNQKSISGQTKMLTEDDMIEQIEYYLESFKDKTAKKEIAFFGGSFTGIDIQTQEKFLKIAKSYIDAGKVDSIRISTRPDYINKNILKMLKKYKVKTIELGVQSAVDSILQRSNRGNTFKDVKKASRLIRWYGFVLGHQMMVGLPESTELDEINTAKKLIKLKPKIVRIYPVLVIKNTKLEKEYNEGIYTPLTIVQAVERCKSIVYLFNKKNIQIIRIGLQTTEEICSPEAESSDVVAGPYHPAFRQLVESSLWYDSILDKIKKLNDKVKIAQIIANPMDVNNIIGHKKENIMKLKETYNLDIQIVQNENIKKGTIKIVELEKYADFLEDGVTK